MTIEFKLATPHDVDEILALHSKYQIDSINEEDKKDGFITTAFNKAQLVELIEAETGLFIALKNNKIIAYVMAASWMYWSKWPMFAHMVNELPNLTYKGYVLSIHNSYQYGPVCVDKSVRGEGIYPLPIKMHVSECLSDFNSRRRFAIRVIPL
jgi:hypothetical protein